MAREDLAALEQMLRERDGSVAAVVVEPCGLETPDDGYLQGLLNALDGERR